MSNYEQARQLVQVLLKGVDNVTPELIREKVSAVLKLVPPSGVDHEELVRDLEVRSTSGSVQNHTRFVSRSYSVAAGPSRGNKMALLGSL